MNLSRIKAVWTAIFLAGHFFAWATGGPALAAPADEIIFEAPEKLADLQKDDISESSGLAPSRANPGLFWTHNDSGGKPRCFAFDRRGRHRGTSRLNGAESRDWEDMGTFTRNGRHYLFVADVGDNGRKRDDYAIYVAREPSNPKRDTDAVAIPFEYSDGPHDCEAVAYDESLGVFLLIEKVLGFRSRVYELEWPTGSVRPPAKRTATLIGRISVPIATAADISTDGQTLAIATYGKGYLIGRLPTETWTDALKRPGQSIALPPRRQGETICFDLQGRDLLLTSEKRPCPLFELRRISENTDRSILTPALPNPDKVP